MSILSRRGSINTGSVDTRPGIQNRGFWNAATNVTTDSSFPSLASGIGTTNYYYVVSVAGTTDLDGNNEWEPNDWALFDGTVWEKIDNSEAGSGDVNGPASAVDDNIATYNFTSGKIIKDGGSKIITEAEGITGNDNDASVPTAAAVKDFVDNNSGSGDVTGPSSATDSNVALFDGTTGKIIKDGGALGALAALNSVSASEIDSGAVNTDELASNAVTTSKILDGNVKDSKLGTGIDAAKIGAGNVDNTEFGYLDGTTSAIQTQIDSKLAEANSIFMPGYSKYCVNNRDDLATVIASITNEATVVNISQGSFGGATPLSIDKDNIALIAPPSTPAMVEFAYEISTATTADRIRMRYLSFDADFNAGSKRSTYNHCTFNEDLNIQTSATAGYMTFANCEFAAGKTISVQNTYASVVYFINCNFAGCSFSLNQASSAQVIFSNCSGFVSFPTNATYTHTNILTTGFSQNSFTKTLLATGSGTSGQMLTSGGAGLPDAWETPIDKTNPSFSGTLQTGAIQITTAPVAGYVLESDASGFGSWQPNNGGGGTALPYKIVRTTGGDYSTVYAAVQAGEQYIFVDGTSAAVVESNDIVSSGQAKVTSDVYIKISGEWQPKRFMQSTSNDLVIEAGNGIWSGTVKMQIPTSPTEAEFLGRSSSFGTETNQTILDGIVWDTTQMTANDYGKFSPTGVFISRNVKALLPNYSGNGLSWVFNNINAPSLAQGQTVINGGGTNCAKGIELGDELIIDALEISGEFTKNNIESDVLLGLAVVYSDPSNFPMVEIKKINWALSNITSGDAYAIVAGGVLSNFDKPSNQTNSTTGKLELYLYYDESNLNNINFGNGKIVQASNGENISLNNCTNIDLVNFNSALSPTWSSWKFNNCEFSNTTSILVIIPNAVYENCTFASTVQNLSTINQRTFRNCTFNGSVSLAGNKNRVDNCIGTSTLTFNGDDNIISNSIIDDTISGNGNRSKFIGNTTTVFNSGIVVNGDYNYFAGNLFKNPLSVTGSYNLQPASSNSIY